MRKNREERDNTFAAVERAASAFKGRPARDVMTEVRSVRTIFPSFDRASQVMGMPLERAVLVHGPSGAGKSLFTMGISKSYLIGAGLVHNADAERTTPISWPVKYIGADLANSDRYMGSRPDTYEDARRELRDFYTTIIRLKKEGKIPQSTPALAIVDSLKKLMPRDLWNKILKLEDEKEHAQKSKGGAKTEDVEKRIGQIKSLLNSIWLDEQIPLLEKSGATLIMIARESERMGATPDEKRRGQGYTVGGGAHVYYDASMVIRVELAGRVWDKPYSADGEKSQRYGDRMRVTIRKTKVSGHEDREEVGYFHTSNGVFVPEGFDVARDLVTLGKELGVVKGAKGGGWLTWEDHRWQGEHKAVKTLTDDPEALAALDRAVRAAFKRAA
jgi:hypothetical protein